MLYNNILDLIGNTPLVKIDDKIYVKLEKANLAGSSKDRVALKMIQMAFKENKINQNSTIIEPTSGNTGIALACICGLYKLKCIIVMPSSMSKERIEIIKSYGASVVLTDGRLGMKGSIIKAKELTNSIENSFIPSQFDNENCILAHYETTAKEIYKDLKDVDCFIAGIGTGATISGVGKYLKEKNPNIHIIGIEPLNSPLLTKNKFGSHKIQGIGANFIPKNLKLEYIDEIIDISDEDAFNMAQKVCKENGLFVGISSGAALKGAEIVKSKYQKIVVLLPDGKDRYLSIKEFENDNNS